MSVLSDEHVHELMIKKGNNRTKYTVKDARTEQTTSALHRANYCIWKRLAVTRFWWTA